MKRSNAVLARSQFLGLAVLLAVTGFATPARAQLDGFTDLTGLNPPGEIAKPKFTISLSPESARTGDEVTLSVGVSLPKGFYIYGTTGEFEGRTQIEVSASGLDELDEEFVPDRVAKSAVDPILKVEMSKFHDAVTWTRRYRVKGDPASVGIRGSLSGQYCSDGTDGPGVCVPIIPAHEFSVGLVPPPRTEYEIPGRNARLLFRLAPADAKPGEKVTLSITAKLDEGWHTYSTKPMGDGSEPTLIELVALRGLKPLGSGFQADHEPKVESPEGLPDIIQEVFHEDVTWSRELEVLPETAAGDYGVRGQFFHQICKKSCVTFETSFALGNVTDAVVVPPEKPGPSREGSTDLVAAPPANADPAGPDAVAAPQPQDQGLIPFLLTAIGFGLVSLLTPCVFPMVPITVTFFLKQSESSHHRPFVTALVFCGSIVATFTILGVGIAAMFGAAQLNNLANNPWLNVFIGSIFVLFAFNMLGLFEIHIPSSLLTFTSNKEQAGGFLGAMFMALTFTLTSFTCTFAFAGTLLVAAAQGQYYWPIIGMIAFGAAFASPFFILALIPSLLRKLPKSGGWMNAVKVVMGLLEIGAAVKFFSVADNVWNPVPLVFDFVFVMIAWLVLSLVIALYLLGVFRLPHDTPLTGISVGRLMLVIAFLGLSLNLSVGLFAREQGGGWIMDQIIALAPPRFEPQHVAVAGPGVERDPNAPEFPQPSLSHHGNQFALDVDKGIAYAKTLNRPILLDFTGINCVNCRLMELKMAEPVNRNLLSKLVLVQLYLDKVPTIRDAAEARRLKKRNEELQIQLFKNVTLPTYAVVAPDGTTILSSYFGLEAREGEFAKFLEAGLQKWESRNKVAQRTP